MGVFEIVLGLAAPLGPMVALGLVLLAAGVWNLCRTSVTGLIVDGLAAILSGIFLCLAWQWVGDAHTGKVDKWILGGALHIVWGVRRLALYRTARFAPDDPWAIARLEATVRELAKASANEDPTVVEFRTGRFRRHRNRLGLYNEGAIALLEHQVVRLEKRTDIWIEARGSTLGGRAVPVGIQMSDLPLEANMPAAHLERFERWKLGLTQPRSIAA